MKKVNVKIAKQDIIDWNKSQWIQNVNDPSVIALYCGKHKGNYFEGVILPCDAYPLGFFSINMLKSLFKKLEQDIPFIISNND